MRRSIGLGIFGGLAALAAVTTAPAQAACVLSGGTVTCTGSDDDGFSGSNALTVRVETGAAVDSIYDGNPDTICPAFRAALRLGLNAQVTNLGQIAGRGNCAIGVESGNGLTLTNDGTILADSQVSFGVLTTDGFNVTNRGMFNTTNSGSAGFVGVNGGTFSNAAAGVIETFGAGASGITAENANTITNAGRITLRGAGSFGIDLNASNTVTNSGTITASGVASAGIRLRGASNTLTNSGTFSALPSVAARDGEDSIGLLVEGNTNTITNSGTISGDYAGVVLNGLDNTLSNSGTISARAPTASTPGGGIVVDGRAAITNTGTIRGTGAAAIRVRGAGLATITNTGRIEGDIIIGSGGGIITIGTGGVVTGTIFGPSNGFGGVRLIGSGTLTTAFSNVNSLTVETDSAWTLGRNYSLAGFAVRRGTVTLTDGVTMSGFINVDRDGRLAGVGRIAASSVSQSLSVVVEGALAPGLAGQPGVVLSVDRELRSIAGRLEFDVAGMGADRIDAGTVRVVNTAVAVTYGGAPVRDGQTFTLISANSIASTLPGQSCAGTVQEGAGAGCFSLTDNSPYFIRSSLNVATSNVVLRVQRQAFASIAVTPEETGLAQYFDRAVATGANPGGVISLLDQQTEAEARATFGTLSSDLPVSAQTWGVLSAGSMAAATSPWLELAPADSKRGEWRTWGAMFLRGGETGRNAGVGAFDYELRGAVAAADYAVIDGTRLGVLLARLDGETFLAAGAAKADNAVTSAGVYISQAWPQWRAGAGYIVGDGRSRMNRISTVGAAVAAQTARTDLDSETAFGQLSYSTGTEMWLVKPTAMLTYARGKVGAYTESAALGLSVQRQSGSSLRGDVGVRAIAKPGPVHVSLGAFWSQNLKDNDRTARAALIGLPGSDFTIAGAAEKRGWLNTQVGVNIEVLPGLMARLNWSGILNDRLGGHTASAGLSYRW